MYVSSTTTVAPLASVSCEPNLPASEGPRPEPSGKWQLTQPNCSNSCCPRAVIDMPPPPPSHAWYSFGSMTNTRPIMPECLVPQYSAQNRWYSPALVGVNHTEL